MSAPLRLTAQQLRNLGDALDLLTQAHHRYGVRLTPYTRLEVGIGDSVVACSWDDDYGDRGGYVIDDRNGD